MSTQPDVLIVGAGPSGLVLALLLCRNGLSVRIIDKSTDFKVGQRATGIHARTLELYKLLGILPKVEKHLTKFPPMKIYIPGQDEPITRGPLVEELPMEPQYLKINYEILLQEDHQDILREVLRAEYGCFVENAELENFTQDGEGVSVNLVKEDKQETVRVKWLVGADGARSTVRKQLGLTFLGNSDTTVSLIISDIEIENFGDLDENCWSMWGNQNDKLAGLSPYTRNGKKLAFFAMGGAKLDVEEAAKTRESMISAFYEITGKKDVVFGSFHTNPSIWRSNVRMANKFQEGRVFIVGDAGHVHSFTGGQGMNSGVQDSFNLAWKLALVQKGLSPHSLIDSYNTERVPVIAAMLEIATGILKKDLSSNIPAFGQSTRGFEIRQLGITYRGTSPILVDERYPDIDPEEVDLYRSGLDGTVHAGDRAPEAPGLKRAELQDGEMTSVYEFLDVTSHTVLLFGRSISDVQGLLDLVAKYPRSLVKTLLVLPQGSEVQTVAESVVHQVLIDAEGYAYKNYGIQPGETFAIIIRPDGYIGAAANGVDGLSRYFSVILG